MAFVDKFKGLYNKYLVERVDKSPKHDGCEYFVLDMSCDPYAVPALYAYAHACRAEYPQLAKELIARAEALAERKHGTDSR